MKNWLRNLSPNQRRALMIGVPVVAVIVLVQRATGRVPEAMAPSDPEADDAGAAGDGAGFSFPGWIMPGTDAIGTGALMDFISQMNQNQSNFLAQLTEMLKDQEETITPAPPPTPNPTPNPTPPPAPPTPPPAPPKPPTPPPAAYNPHNDPQLGKRTSVVAAGGETIGQLSARLFKDAKWWQELYWLNAGQWNAYAESIGQKITAPSFRVAGGMIAKY